MPDIVGRFVSEQIIARVEATIPKATLNKRRPMARLIGAPESWQRIWAFAHSRAGRRVWARAGRSAALRLLPL